jgi:hypothetical protein
MSLSANKTIASRAAFAALCVAQNKWLNAPQKTEVSELRRLYDTVQTTYVAYLASLTD